RARGSRRRAAPARHGPLPVHRGPGRRGQALGDAMALHRRRRVAHRRGGAAGGAVAQGRGRGVRGRVRGVGGLSASFGLDVGTSSVKGLALAEDGTVVASASEEYPFATPRPGWTEQDPELWWSASERVLAALRAAAGE